LGPPTGRDTDPEPPADVVSLLTPPLDPPLPVVVVPLPTHGCGGGGVVGLMRDGMVTGHVRPKQIARLNTTFSRVQTIARTTIIIITPTTAVVILRCAASTFALSPPEVTHSNAPCSKKKSAAMPAIVKKPLIANVSRSEKVGMVKPSKLVCTCRSEQGIGVRVVAGVAGRGEGVMVGVNEGAGVSVGSGVKVGVGVGVSVRV